MILYHAISVYQILCCIAHRLESYPQQKAVLILPDFIKTKFKNYQELGKQPFFEEVYLFPYSEIKHDESTVYESVEKAYKKTIPYALDEFENVINAGMHFYFSLYLIKHNKKFEAFEDSAGVLSRGTALGDSIRCSNENFYQIIEKQGLYTADNALIIKCYCNMKAQQEGFFNEKAVDFDLMEKMQGFDKEIVDILLKVFNCPSNIKVDNPEALILTQHFSNLNQMEFEEQVLLYQTVVDYFLQDKNLIIKPHPDDITYYGKLFPNAKIIREKFPSELLPFIFTEMPQKLVSVSSTGSHLIKNLFKEKLLFSFEYETTFRFTHRYYFALRILRFLNIKEFQVEGTDTNLIKNLLCDSNLAGMEISPNGRACIVDDLDKDILKEEDDYEILIFLNTDQNYQLFEKMRSNEIGSLMPVEISKKRIRETDNYDDPSSEILFIYTKSEELNAMLKGYSETKTLESSGNMLKVEVLDEAEQKIKVLEGMLEATEKRMLFYKKRCDELEEK